MSCPYENNYFCGLLSNASKYQLCTHCRVKKYVRGQILPKTFWDNHVTLLLSGLMICRRPDGSEAAKAVTTGIASQGNLISIGGLLKDCSETPAAMDDCDFICILDSTVAVFDPSCTAELFDSDIEFVKAVFANSIRFCCRGTAELMQYVGSKDAYSAVRYVVQYCRKHQLPQLTHEQISLISNRSRPTVTELLHTLTQNEPDLFLR